MNGLEAGADAPPTSTGGKRKTNNKKPYNPTRGQSSQHGNNKDHDDDDEQKATWGETYMNKIVARLMIMNCADRSIATKIDEAIRIGGHARYPTSIPEASALLTASARAKKKKKKAKKKPQNNSNNNKGNNGNVNADSDEDEDVEIDDDDNDWQWHLSAMNLTTQSIRTKTSFGLLLIPVQLQNMAKP